MTISLVDVEKIYPSGFHAVHKLNLEIKEGEFFTLLGASGSGKSTTLRMIAGLESVSRGRVFINEFDCTTVHPRDRDVAMVFQSYALYPHMTVRQNLALSLKVRKIAAEEIERRVKDVADILGLDERLESKPGQLSGGQRQRVALGRAIIRHPNVFLMDEPLSNLDLKLREKTRTELKRLHERLRVTTVYVTHDQAEALVLSDRIGVMSEGRLLQVGTPDEIYKRPCSIFVAKFIGSPSINLIGVSADKIDESRLRLRLVNGDVSIPDLLFPVAESISSRIGDHSARLVLGVRPEAVCISSDLASSGFVGHVDLVEPMGSFNHVILSLPDLNGEITSDGEPLTAVVRSNEPYAQGDAVKVLFRPNALVLFDLDSGEAVATLGTRQTWIGCQASR